MNYKKLLSSVSFLSFLVCAHVAGAYETTTFSVSLGDATKTGTMMLGNGNLGDNTASITTGARSYNYAYQYFTPASSGTYVFGQLSAPVDSVILLYSPLFDAAHPNLNYLDSDDDFDLDDDLGEIPAGALQTYVSTAIASSSCDGYPSLCPLLVASLTAGTDYYVVVSTYSEGDSLGTASDSLSFYVIGDSSVGVGGQPPAGSGYVVTAETTPMSPIADYLNDNDNSGDLTQVATYLNTASEPEVVDALKRIFPVNASAAPEAMTGATGQTATVLIDKVGTVLGGVSAPSGASFTDGSFNTAEWVFGGAVDRASAPATLGFTQQSYNESSEITDPVKALASTPYERHQDGDQAFWVQGVGGITNGEATAATLSYDVTSYGVVSGYEYALGEDNLVGTLASVFRSNVDLDTNAGSVDATTYALGIYGQHLIGSVKLTGVFLASYAKYDSNRYVDVGGITGSPKANYNGWGTSTSLQVSKLYEHAQVKLEPFASFNYSTSSTEGYSEAGGGVYNMVVSSDVSSSVTARGGVTVMHSTKLSGRTLDLKARPYMGYHFAPNEASNTVRLSGASTGVVLNGRDTASLEFGLGLEANYKLSDAHSVKLGADLSHSKSEDSGLIYAGYGVKF